MEFHFVERIKRVRHADAGSADTMDFWTDILDLTGVREVFTMDLGRDILGLTGVREFFTMDLGRNILGLTGG